MTKRRALYMNPTATICVDKVDSLGNFVTVKVRNSEDREAAERMRGIIETLGLGSCKRAEYEPNVLIPYKDFMDNVRN